MFDESHYEVNSIEDALDYGLIERMHRVIPKDRWKWDETCYYHVKFYDGTVRDFFEAADILRFIKKLIEYWENK